MADGSAPAWMLCEDMITRLKDELILEAVDILHGEMKAKRIDISGYVSLLPDKPSELQRDMYIIGNLVQREGEIVEQYRPFLDDMGAQADPQKVARAEELRKFMLSVQAISELMRLSEIAEKWAEDTGRYSKLEDVEGVMMSTVGTDVDRIEVLNFALSSRRFLKSEALTEREIDILRRTRSAMESGNGRF